MYIYTRRICYHYSTPDDFANVRAFTDTTSNNIHTLFMYHDRISILEAPILPLAVANLVIIKMDRTIVHVHCTSYSIHVGGRGL